MKISHSLFLRASWSLCRRNLLTHACWLHYSKGQHGQLTVSTGISHQKEIDCYMFNTLYLSVFFLDSALAGSVTDKAGDNSSYLAKPDESLPYLSMNIARSTRGRSGALYKTSKSTVIGDKISCQTSSPGARSSIVCQPPATNVYYRWHWPTGICSCIYRSFLFPVPAAPCILLLFQFSFPCHNSLSGPRTIHRTGTDRP